MPTIIETGLEMLRRPRGATRRELAEKLRENAADKNNGEWNDCPGTWSRAKTLAEKRGYKVIPSRDPDGQIRRRAIRKSRPKKPS